MKKILLMTVLLILFLVPRSLVSSSEIPSFLPHYFAPAFEIKGQMLKFVNHTILPDGVEHYFYFTSDRSLSLLIENIKCDRPRGEAFFKEIRENLNYRPNVEFLEINERDIHARYGYNDSYSLKETVFAFVLPSSVQIWTYVMRSSKTYEIAPQFQIIRNYINKLRGENMK